MRNLLNTPTKALLADVACWTALVGLLVCVGVTADNQLLAGVMLTVATLLGLFALVYNGRNLKTVLRRRRDRAISKRNLENERVRRAEEEKAILERDAAYGRELRNLNNRYYS